MAKISKLTFILTLIIVAVVISGYFFLSFLKNKNFDDDTVAKKNYPDSKIVSEKKIDKKIIETTEWKICNNKEMHYKISYPSGWKMYQGAYGPPSSVPLSKCDGNDIVVFASHDMWIKPPDVKYLDIDVSNEARLNETIYKGSKTLDEYFSKNPLLLKTSPIIKETVINGERVVWFSGLPSPYFMFFHNGILFEIQGQNLNSELFNNFLSTFKFVD